MGIEAALIGGGASLLGGVLGGNSAKDAANTQSQAQLQAAQIAADAARFKPVGMTTAFGSSNFGFGPDGNLSSAGYSLNPQLAAQRDAFLGQAAGSGMNLANQAGQAGQGLFNLGQGYLAQSPEAAAQQYLQTQQAALAPGQERQLANIRNNQFQRGTSGLAVGATDAGGMGASNPELQAYYNSIAQTNLGLQGQAQQEGRAQTAFGQTLLGGGIDLTSQGYNPYKTQFGLGQSLENAGQDAFRMSSELGGRSAQAGAQVGNTLFAGGNNAAASLARGAGSGIGNALSSLGGNQQLMSGLNNYFGGSGQNSSWYGNGGGYQQAQQGGGFFPYGGSSFDVGNNS
jgi:hypothetical protein